MDKLRLRYEQTGTAAWISHLDMVRTLQRALSRANVPIKYSEGFNPHALLSILLPLSVGTESLCQLADILLREDVELPGLPERLSAAMPEGLRVTACYEPATKVAGMKWLEAEGVWEYAVPTDLDALKRFFAAPALPVRRKTKRGEGVLDLKPHLRRLSLTERGGNVLISAVISASEPVINPDWLAEALRQNLPDAAPERARFLRREVFGEDGEPFR